TGNARAIKRCAPAYHATIWHLSFYGEWSAPIRGAVKRIAGPISESLWSNRERSAVCNFASTRSNRSNPRFVPYRGEQPRRFDARSRLCGCVHGGETTDQSDGISLC